MTAPSTISTNHVNTAMPAYEVSTASPDVNTASPQVSTARFSDNDVYAFKVENPNGSNLLQQDLEQIHEDDMEAMDLKWQLSLLSMRASQECFQLYKMALCKGECRAPRSKEGQFRNQDNTRKQGNNGKTHLQRHVGYRWCRPNKLDLSYSGLDEFKEPEFKGYGTENSTKKTLKGMVHQKKSVKINCDANLQDGDGLDNENDAKDKSDDDSSPKEVNAAKQHVNTASPDVTTGSFKLNVVGPSVNTNSSYDQDSPKDIIHTTLYEVALNSRLIWKCTLGQRGECADDVEMAISNCDLWSKNPSRMSTTGAFVSFEDKQALFEGRLLMSIFKAWMEGYEISNVCLKESKTSRHVKRGRDTKIPQFSGPSVKVGNEAVHKELGDIMERAANAASSLEVEQDSGNIK
ncbi:hypothetical protein Tco_1329634 [Tanacetum coccineum]